MKRLCATVLVMEAIVIGLAIPVAITIGHEHAAGLAGGCLAWPRCCSRAWSAGPASRGVLAAGSALQLLVIAAGVVVPVMYALGAIFAGFWVLAIVMGRRAESSAPPAVPGRPGAGPR